MRRLILHLLIGALLSAFFLLHGTGADKNYGEAGQRRGVNIALDEVRRRQNRASNGEIEIEKLGNSRRDDRRQEDRRQEDRRQEDRRQEERRDERRDGQMSEIDYEPVEVDGDDIDVENGPSDKFNTERRRNLAVRERMAESERRLAMERVERGFIGFADRRREEDERRERERREEDRRRNEEDRRRDASEGFDRENFEIDRIKIEIDGNDNVDSGIISLPTNRRKSPEARRTETERRRADNRRQTTARGQRDSVAEGGAENMDADDQRRGEAGRKNEEQRRREDSNRRERDERREDSLGMVVDSDDVMYKAPASPRRRRVAPANRRAGVNCRTSTTRRRRVVRDSLALSDTERRLNIQSFPNRPEAINDREERSEIRDRRRMVNAPEFVTERRIADDAIHMEAEDDGTRDRRRENDQKSGTSRRRMSGAESGELKFINDAGILIEVIAADSDRRRDDRSSERQDRREVEDRRRRDDENRRTEQLKSINYDVSDYTINNEKVIGNDGAAFSKFLLSLVANLLALGYVLPTLISGGKKQKYQSYPQFLDTFVKHLPSDSLKKEFNFKAIEA